MASKKTKDGGKITINSRGEKIYDLTNSSDILKDMNRAILDETKKSGSAPGATEWFLGAIEQGQIELPNEHDITLSLLKNKANVCSKKYMTLPGRMFTFLYHPKTKKELEYYDITPLIITLPREKTEETDNVLGINLHYLEPDIRAELLERMLRMSQKRLGEKTPPKGVGYFRMDYNILKTIRYVFGMPCIRSYDTNRIIGRPVIVPSNQWGNAVALPYQNFVKAKSRKVWVESRLLIREFIKSIAYME
jgi:hypothetical protein